MSGEGAGGAIWAALPSPVLIVDHADDVLAANPAAEAMFNASARHLAGRCVWAILDLSDAPRAAMSRARTQSAPLILNEVDITLAPGVEVPATIQIAPFDGARGGEMIVLVVAQEAAGRLGRSRAVRATARSAIGMAEMLAHEIKNPLAGITGAAQLLSMSLDDEGRELTDLIVAESRRVVSLLEQVEQFGDIRPPAQSPVNLHDILARAKSSAEVGFASAMHIQEYYDPSLPPACGDADQLLQVVQNLVRNAAEAAGGAGGTITLRTRFDRGMRVRDTQGSVLSVPLQVEVEDDGPGLPDEIANEVFDPFVSGRENGTGLGLALAVKIVAAHGGLIGVTSRPGRTVFRISLQAAPRDTKEAA